MTNDTDTTRQGAGQAIDDTWDRIRDNDSSIESIDDEMGDGDSDTGTSGLEDLDTDDLTADPDLPFDSIPRGEGQRSGSRLDADGSYAAGSAARDALEDGSGLEEDDGELASDDDPDHAPDRGSDPLLRNRGIF